MLHFQRASHLSTTSVEAYIQEAEKLANFLNLWGVPRRKILSNPAASCCCAFQSHLLLRPGSNFPASLVWMGLCTGEAKYLILGGFIKILQISQNWFLFRIIERLLVWMGLCTREAKYLLFGGVMKTLRGLFFGPLFGSIL